MATLERALQMVTGLARPELEALIDRAIDLLDLVDGDADLEPEVDEEDDPPGDDELLPLPPVYGEDQSLGPINEHAARLLRRRLMVSRTGR